MYRFCVVYSADRQEFVSGSAAAVQPAHPVARPTRSETGHRAGRRRTASDAAAAGRPVRVLSHTGAVVEQQAARLPKARPARHLAIR